MRGAQRRWKDGAQGDDDPDRGCSRGTSKMPEATGPEQLALDHLGAQRHGLRLVCRNFRTPGRGGGEIDLVMRERDGTLVFVEVRQRRSLSHGRTRRPASWPRQATPHRLPRAISCHGWPPAYRRRFDAVLLRGDASTVPRPPAIGWLRAAFLPTSLCSTGLPVYHPRHAFLQRIQQQFIDSADLQYQVRAKFSARGRAALGAILASVTGGGKVLACGNGASVGWYRPLRAPSSAASSATDPNSRHSRWAATPPSSPGFTTPSTRVGLCAPGAGAGPAGRYLLVVTSLSQAPEILGAVEAAHERE